MAIDTRSHRPNNLVHNLWISGKSSNLSFVLLGETETSKLIMGFHDVISFHDRCEDREAIAIVKLCIIVVAVNASDLNLLSGFGRIYKVPEQYHFSVARKPTSRDRARRF